MKYDISKPLQALKGNMRTMEFARKLGCEPNTASAYICGNKLVGVRAAKRIAENLRIPVEDLLGFTPVCNKSYPDNVGQLPKSKQAGEAAVLRMLEKNGNGVPYLKGK